MRVDACKNKYRQNSRNQISSLRVWIGDADPQIF